MGRADTVFEELARREPLPEPAEAEADVGDDGGDLRALPDGRILALGERWREREIARGSRATWD